MHTATVDEAGRLDLGDVARQLGYRPGALVQVIRTSAGTLILAIDDTPVLIEATGRMLPSPQKQRALSGRAGARPNEGARLRRAVAAGEGIIRATDAALTTVGVSPGAGGTERWLRGES